MSLEIPELARLCRVTEKTIHVWIKAGMPVETAGSQGRGKKTFLNLERCIEWYFENNFERMELDRARTRLASEQAEKTRMENDLRRADLAEVSVIGMVVDDLVANAKTNLLALARRIAPGLEGLNVREREEAISAHIRQCLEDLSSYRPKRPGARSVGRDHGKDHAEGAKASAAHDGERVGGRKPRAEPRGKRGTRKVANRES